MSLAQEAWHVVLKRTRADWLVLAAAGLIVLLAVSLLAAGVIYGDAVATSGLHRALRDAPVTTVDLQVTSGADLQHADEHQAAVTRVVRRTFGSLPVTLLASGRSGTFALPNQDPVHVTDLAVLGFYDDLAQHATLVSGAWPQQTPALAIAAAVSEPVAATLGLSLGDHLTVDSRLDEGLSVDLELVGIYRLNDPADPYWWDDQLEIEGTQGAGDPYTYHGPFVIDRGSFLADVPPAGSQLRWRAYPDYESLGLDRVDLLRGNVAGAREQLISALDDPDVLLSTGLPGLLGDLQLALLATRTAVLLLTVQLAVLAGYALAMTAGLVVEQRRAETAMLRSRGADQGQVGALALMEGLILAVPVAIAAPYLASLALAGLNAVGPLASIGLRLNPQVTLLSVLVSAMAAGACVAALTIPALRAGRVFMEQRRGRGRQLRLGAAQRAGVDLALLGLAAIGLWQLQRYGTPLTQSVQGQIGIDPLLVAAPALGLLAGAVLALRIVPLASRAVEAVVTRTRGAVAPLGAWQLARRPGRYARAGLLLILALALGIFSVAYASSWTDAQADQAAFQVGADVRITSTGRAGDLPPIDAAGAYGGLPGVTGAMPVERGAADLPRSRHAVTMALDATQAPAVIRIRPDLATSSLAELGALLSGSRPAAGLPPLPADARQLGVTIALNVDPDPETGEIPTQSFGVSLVVRDATGLVHRLDAGRLDPAASGARAIRMQAGLASPEAGPGAVPRGPLQLMAVEVWTEMPADQPLSGNVRVVGLESATGVSDWKPVSLDPGPAGWQLKHFQRIGVEGGTIVAQPVEGALAAYRFNTGARPFDIQSEITFALQPGSLAAATLHGPVPLVADAAFLQATAARVGDEVPLELAGGVTRARIVGTLTAFPTSERDVPTAIVDLPTLALARYQASGEVSEPREWWLAVAPTSVDAVVAALHRGAFITSLVQSSALRTDQLRSDPVAIGVIGALLLGAVAATIFAAVGFAASSAISARERLSEFALLRAVGLSQRQLSGWLALENALLVVMSVIAGTGIGLAISWAVLPSALLARDGSVPLPAPIVLVPLGLVALLEAVLVVVLGVLVLVLTAFLRRLGLGAVLRVGEE